MEITFDADKGREDKIQLNRSDQQNYRTRTKSMTKSSESRIKWIPWSQRDKLSEEGPEKF